MRTVTFKFSGGKVEIKTAGFVGKQCLAETKDVKEALGVTVTETPTPELHAGLRNNNAQRANQGG